MNLPGTTTDVLKKTAAVGAGFVAAEFLEEAIQSNMDAPLEKGTIAAIKGAAAVGTAVIGLQQRRYREEILLVSSGMGLSGAKDAALTYLPSDNVVRSYISGRGGRVNALRLRRMNPSRPVSRIAPGNAIPARAAAQRDPQRPENRQTASVGSRRLR